MTRFLDLIRSLGNAGAVANAQVLLDERRREDWEVRSLLRRITPAAPVAARAA